MKTTSTSLEEKLKELLKSSEELRSALIRNQTEAIWQSLIKQENITRDIQRSMPNNPQEKEDGDKIISLTSKIKRIQRTNKMLSKTFLNLIKNTLASFNKKAGNNSGTYAASGRMSNLGTPILIHQKG